MPDYQSSSSRHLANAMRADDIGSPVQVAGPGRLIVGLVRLVAGLAGWAVRRVRYRARRSAHENGS
jgi:hypothetical protein